MGSFVSSSLPEEAGRDGGREAGGNLIKQGVTRPSTVCVTVVRARQRRDGAVEKLQ